MSYFKRLARLIFPVLIIGLLLGGVLGCGAPEEEAIEEEEEVVEEEKEAIVDNWYNPTEEVELVETFKELEYVWTEIRGGEEADSFTVSYRDEGSENVSGVDTTKAVFIADEQEVIIWIDEDGSAVQAEVDGQLLPKEFADQALQTLQHIVFVPFLAIEDHRIGQALTDVTVEGYDWSIISTERAQFNGVEAEVTTVEVNVSPPVVPEGDEATLLWSVGDFGDFQMLTKYDIIKHPAADDLNFTLEVTKVVPR